MPFSENRYIDGIMNFVNGFLHKKTEMFKKILIDLVYINPNLHVISVDMKIRKRM